MRDVNYGWLMRYMHANGASMFFLAVYIHIFRGLYYGSYKEPREVLWILGVIIFLLMMATAFMGYVLPWGQMSFWARDGHHQPVLGDPARRRADRHAGCGAAYAVDQPTLQPLLLAALPAAVHDRRRGAAAHLGAARAGQNNPTGIDVKTRARTRCRSTPYCTVKDSFGMICFLILFAWFVFYIPNYLGHPDNYIPGQSAADAAAHRARMVLPAVLRDPARDPDKLGGVVAMFASIAVLAFVPWLDTSKVRSARYRPLYKQFFWILLVVCVGLGYLGSKPA